MRVGDGVEHHLHQKGSIDSKELFFGGSQRLQQQQGRGRCREIGRGWSVGTGRGTRRSYQARDKDKSLLKRWFEEEKAVHIPGEREG